MKRIGSVLQSLLKKKDSRKEFPRKIQDVYI